MATLKLGRTPSQVVATDSSLYMEHVPVILDAIARRARSVSCAKYHHRPSNFHSLATYHKAARGFQTASSIPPINIRGFTTCEAFGPVLYLSRRHRDFLTIFTFPTAFFTSFVFSSTVRSQSLASWLPPLDLPFFPIPTILTTSLSTSSQPHSRPPLNLSAPVVGVDVKPPRRRLKVHSSRR